MNEFRLYAINSLDRLIQREYEYIDFSSSDNVILKFDKNLSQVINKFSENGIHIKKGALFYSIRHIVIEALKYMEDKLGRIDEKIISEFCLFILNKYATSAGAKLGEAKEQYKKRYLFMNDLLDELERGV